MSGNYLEFTWMICQRSSNVVFIENNICFTRNNFLNSIDENAKEVSLASFPFNVKLLTYSHELKLIALSSQDSIPVICVFELLNFQKPCNVFYDDEESEYLLLTFSGKDKLVTISRNSDYKIIVWDLTTNEDEIYILSNVTDCDYFGSSGNPYLNNEICIHHSSVIEFYNIEEENVNCKQFLYMPFEDSTDCESVVTLNDIKDLTIFNKLNHVNWGIHSETFDELKLSMLTDLPDNEMISLHDFLLQKTRMKPTHHCWLPWGDLIVCCSNNLLLYFDTSSVKLSFLPDIRKSPRSFNEKLNVITALAAHDKDFYVGKKSGLIWKFVFNSSNSLWIVEKIIDIDILISNFFFSPNYSTLTVIAFDGSLFLLKIGNNKFYSPICLIRSYAFSSSIVGICMLSKFHCLTARKNGLLELWDIDDGSYISHIDLECTVECMEGSPLCSLALVGTNAGYIFAVDVVKASNIRTIKIFRPFGSPISKIVYENYGRYVIIASVESKKIFLINGMPSSNFVILGYFNIPGNIIDVNIFTPSIDDNILISVIVKHINSENEEEIFNAISIKFPEDFFQSYQIFWKNDYGLFDDKIYKTMELRYSHISSSVLHKKLGVLLYEAEEKKVKNIYIHSSSTVQSKVCIATVHETKNCKLFLDNTHDWILSLGNDGRLAVYGLLDKSCIYMAQFSKFNLENNHFIACFSNYKPIIVVGNEDGAIICYSWHPPVLCQYENITPWFEHCCSWNDIQNTHIAEMVFKACEPPFVWENVDTITEYKETLNWLIESSKEFLKEFIDAEKSLIDLAQQNYSLSPEFQISTEDFILDESDIRLMTEYKLEALLMFRYDLFTKQQKISFEALKIKENHIDKFPVLRRCVKALQHPQNLYNYSICEQPNEHKSRIEHILEKKRSKLKDEISENEVNALCETKALLYDYLDLKTRERIIDQITILRELIYQIKLDFNNKFESHAIIKEEQKSLILEKIARLKFINSVTNYTEEIWEPDWNFEDDPREHFKSPDELKDMNLKINNEASAFINKNTLQQFKINCSKANRIAQMQSLMKPKGKEEADILSEFEKPEFIDEVLPIHWTKSETNVASEYNTNCQTHEKKKTKYKEKLKLERAQIIISIKELIDNVDALQLELFTEKLNIDFQINLYELNMGILLFTIQVDERLISWERSLKDSIELCEKNKTFMLIYPEIKSKSCPILTLPKVSKDHEAYHQTIKNTVETFLSEKMNKETINAFFNFTTHDKCIDMKNFLLEVSTKYEFVKKTSDELYTNFFYYQLINEIVPNQLQNRNKHFNICRWSWEDQTLHGENNLDFFELKSELSILHEKTLLCRNNVPLVFSVTFKGLEIETPIGITASCFLLKTEQLENWHTAADIETELVHKVIKDGAEVRYNLKQNFVEYRRFNLKIEENENKLATIEAIPMSKEIKAVMSEDKINPYAKSENLLTTSQYEKLEFNRQIKAAENEKKKIEDKIHKQIMEGKALEKKITDLTLDLNQLKYLNEEIN